MEHIIVSRGAMHESLTVFCYYSVVDADSEIRAERKGAAGGWGGGGAVSKKNFQPFRSQFGLKTRGWGQATVAPPLDSPLLFSVL